MSELRPHWMCRGASHGTLLRFLRDIPHGAPHRDAFGVNIPLDGMRHRPIPCECARAWLRSEQSCWFLPRDIIAKRGTAVMILSVFLYVTLSSDLNNHRSKMVSGWRVRTYWAGQRRRVQHTIRYDMVDLRALKSWRDGQLNLAHGPETKNNEKIKIKNRVAQKKRCRQRSVEALREEEVKEVGFKLGVREMEL